MIYKGMKIQAPGMLLKVTDMRGTWVRCDYFDKDNGAWKPRGYTENRSYLERRIKDGVFMIVE